MEILLVEDNLIDAKLAIAALKTGDIQHRLTLIRDGEEALEFLEQRGKFIRAPRPDLILLDLFLPRVDGRELLRQIKHDDNLQSIPVVILTASEFEDDRVDCEHLHVDSYMTKPVNLDKFLDVVRQLKKFWLADVILPQVD
jgi:CheY-like chemotaxis protein